MTDERIQTMKTARTTTTSSSLENRTRTHGGGAGTHHETSHPLLDKVLQMVVRGDLAGAADRLFAGLDEILGNSSDEEWKRFVKEVVPQHALAKIIHLDPLSHRAFAKPRGYAGDAVLLDYIYGILDARDQGHVSQWLYDYCSKRFAIRAVRARRRIIAKSIDACAAKNPGRVRVLSVACGHLREAQVSRAVENDHVRELIALDSDAKSLAVAASASSCVKPQHMSVRQMLAGKADFGRFDLIYSSGLYDYLEDRVAQRLTRSLFRMLVPGGRLVLCNFLPTTPDIGYIESFMDWELRYRDRQEIIAFADEIDRSEIASTRYHEDAFRSIGYFELEKGEGRSDREAF
ncbi:MAG: class I SAM-dependent methyltransferase [Planctomycetes bacterium]|nr:class I SAM-dependent methyltransferase [Planctomycetota bacterium]